MTFNVGDQVVWISDVGISDVVVGKIYTLIGVEGTKAILFVDDEGVSRYRRPAEVRLHKTAAQVAAEAKAAERKPWDILREAADIYEQQNFKHLAYGTRSLAKRLEEEANVPDPIEVLRQCDEELHRNWVYPENMTNKRLQSIWRDAKRILAAHDKQKKEV